jgi:hypothetical protein
MFDSFHDVEESQGGQCPRQAGAAILGRRRVVPEPPWPRRSPSPCSR